jgi:hypothetical protein
MFGINELRITGHSLNAYRKSAAIYLFNLIIKIMATIDGK